jgi:hypothetical protein
MKKILFALIFLFSFQFGLAVNPSPIINVTDTDFGDVTVGQRAKREIVISNTGSAELYITSFSGPFDSSFAQTGLPTMSPVNPLKLMPNASYKFDVAFTPIEEKTYSDKIIFTNNARTIDSTALLLGRGVKAHLEAIGYDWGRRRIDLPDLCPSGPYLNKEAIHLINNDSKDITIYTIKIKSDIKGNTFEFNMGVFKNLIIKPGEERFFPVSFFPWDIGIHEMSFIIDNSDSSNTMITLKGIGAWPSLETKDVFFDSTIIQDYSNPNYAKQKIFFTNKHWTDADGTDVSDSTTIDLKIGPNGDEISTDGINWGTEGFRFDKTKIRHSRLGDNLTFPVVVYPGDSLEIVGVQFVAQHPGGIHKATILTMTDGCAEVGVLSNWTGRGIDPTAVEEYVNEENIGRLLGYYDILGRRINSIEQYHGLYLEIRMEKNKVFKKIVYKD